jgi:hypothetical protein
MDEVESRDDLVRRLSNKPHPQRQRIIWDGARDIDGAWVLIDLKRASPADLNSLSL